MPWRQLLGRVFRRMGLPMWTFLGVGIAAVWFNTLSSLAEKTVRDFLGIEANTPLWLTYVPPVTVIVLPFLVVALLMRFLPRRRVSLISALEPPKPKKGLIILVSKAESALFAIQWHLERGQLEHVWLIPSNENEAAFFGRNTRAVADEIKRQSEELAKRCGRALQVEIHPNGVSPADAQDTYDYVNRIYRRGLYEPGELIADFTGGTKPMSVGMIMACLPTDRELEYVSFHPESKLSHGPFLIDYQHSAFDLIG